MSPGGEGAAYGGFGAELGSKAPAAMRAQARPGARPPVPGVPGRELGHTWKVGTGPDPALGCTGGCRSGHWAVPGSSEPWLPLVRAVLGLPQPRRIPPARSAPGRHGNGARAPQRESLPRRLEGLLPPPLYGTASGGRADNRPTYARLAHARQRPGRASSTGHPRAAAPHRCQPGHCSRLLFSTAVAYSPRHLRRGLPTVPRRSSPRCPGVRRGGRPGPAALQLAEQAGQQGVQQGQALPPAPQAAGGKAAAEPRLRTGEPPPAPAAAPWGSPAIQHQPALLLQLRRLPRRPEHGLQAEVGGEAPPALCARGRSSLPAGHCYWRVVTEQSLMAGLVSFPPRCSSPRV